MGQGRSASGDVAGRLVYCLNRAHDIAPLQALLHRATPDRMQGPTRYAILVHHTDEPLRQALRALHLGVDLRDRGEWMIMGPGLDHLSDAAREAVFEATVLLMNETLGRSGSFSLMVLSSCCGRRLMIEPCPERQPKRKYGGFGR